MPGGAHQRRVIRGRRAVFSQLNLITVIVMMSKLRTSRIGRTNRRNEPAGRPGASRPGSASPRLSCNPPNPWMPCSASPHRTPARSVADSSRRPGQSGACTDLWAGSPTASCWTGLRLNAPLRWPSSSAASTPPPKSWALPGVAAQSLQPPRPQHACLRPQAVRQRAIAASRQRTGRPPTPALDPVFMALTLAPNQPGSDHRSCPDRLRPENGQTVTQVLRKFA
jgi:hypothetical protein